MKMTSKLVLLLAATASAGALLFAQDNGGNGQGGPQDGRGPGRPGGGRGGHRPPPPAIIQALDANHDGVIDADEIANAVDVLKKLDKNGDGKLTPDEFIGPRPQGPGGHGGNGGPEGQDGPPGPPRGGGTDGQNDGPPPGPGQ